MFRSISSFRTFGVTSRFSRKTAGQSLIKYPVTIYGGLSERINNNAHFITTFVSPEKTIYMTNFKSDHIQPHIPESQNPDVFVDSNNEQMNKEIFEYCKKLEALPNRQKSLFEEYIKNVRFSSDLSKIIICDGISRKYSIDSSMVLSSLYQHVLSLKQYKPSNMFNLPLTKIVGSITYDYEDISNNINNGNDTKSLRKPRVRLFDVEDRLFKEYEENMNKSVDGVLPEFHKIMVKEYSRNVIFRKGNDYDVIELRTEVVPNKDNTQHTVNLLEIKDPKRTLDYIVISQIIKESAKFGYYINKLGDVQINDVFDQSNVYNMKNFDDMYGKGEFNSVILWMVNFSRKETGSLSIRHQKTIDLIRETAKKMSGNDKDIEEKLYTDFVNLSSHDYSDEHVEIGKLMDHYNINSQELLYVMYTNNMPFNAGFFDFAENFDKATEFKLEDAQKVLERQHYYVDYLYGKPIKNNFRKYKGEKQQIRIKKYDDRTCPGNFYSCFMYLMVHKLKNSPKAIGKPIDKLKSSVAQSIHQTISKIIDV